MPCEFRSKVIDGEEWKVHQRPPTEAMKLEMRLAPVIASGLAPVLVKGLVAFSEHGAKTDVSEFADSLPGVISGLFSSMSPDQMGDLFVDLLSDSTLTRAGRRVEFEKDFAGPKAAALRYKVAWFVLEANLADFFGSILPESLRLEDAGEVLRGAIHGSPSPDSSGDHASANHSNAH